MLASVATTKGRVTSWVPAGREGLAVPAAHAVCVLVAVVQPPPGTTPPLCVRMYPGIPPDDVLVRLATTDTEFRVARALALATPAAGLPLLAPSRNELVTVYAGEVRASELSRASQAARLFAHVDGAGFGWTIEGGYGCEPNRAAPLAAPPLPLTLAPPPPQTPSSARPPCARMDEPGAWVRASSLTDEGGTLGPNADGLVWRAHACSYTRLTGDAARASLEARFSSASPRILMLGASNNRREWKTLAGLAFAPNAAPGSSSWCADRRADRTCVCEDNKERGAFDANAPAGGGLATFSLGRVAVAHLHMTGILDAVHGGRGWLDLIVEAGAAARYDAVVFDLVAWEMAFGWLQAFDAELPFFAHALADAFPGARLVWRTPNFFTGPARYLYYNNHAREGLYIERAAAALRAVLGDRLEVWDVFALGEASPLAHTLAQIERCSAAHMDSADEEVAVQVLLNGLGAPRGTGD